MQVDKGGLNDPEAPEEPPAKVVASLETVLEMDAGFLDAMMKWMEEARVEKAEVLNESSGEAGGTWAGPYSPKYWMNVMVIGKKLFETAVSLSPSVDTAYVEATRIEFTKAVWCILFLQGILLT